MGWFHRFVRTGAQPQPQPVALWMEGCDGTCFVQISPAAPAAAPVTHAPRQKPGLLRGLLGSKGKALGPAVKGRQETRKEVMRVSDMPATALDIVWGLLDADSKRSVRLVSREFRAISTRAISHLSARSQTQDGSSCRGRPPVPEDLSSIHFPAGTGSLQDPQQTVALLSSVQQLRHLRSLVADHGMRGVPFQHLARCLVACPTLTRLHLPHHRFTTTTEQRQLTAVLEALQQLEELDLGMGAEPSTATRLPPTVLRRIARLKRLRVLCCDASAAEDATLFKSHTALRKLHLRLSCADPSVVQLLAALPHLEDVQLQGSALTDGVLEGLTGLTGLERLDVSGCPAMTTQCVQQLTQHTRVTRLCLPCDISDAALSALAQLPSLDTLLTRRTLWLPLPGLDVTPLTCVTQLVTAGVEFRGVGAEVVFPQLQQLVVKRFSAEEAAAVRGCSQLRELVGHDARTLPDRGLAALQGLPLLDTLELHEAAQVSDEGFRLLCSRPNGHLKHLLLSGFSRITDEAFLHLTVACRCLTSLSLKGCPGLTDKTLTRLARCSAVERVTLKRCGRHVTEVGLVSLVMQGVRVTHVEVSACPGVLLARRPSGRPGLRLTIDGRSL